MNRLLISAAHKSSGKTTLSIGLCAAFKATNHAVQPFKKGPDYIDPMWLSRACGRDCHNLDFYTMSRDEILATIQHYSTGADIAIIEGNKGLYDGLDIDGSNSNAALALLSQTPVILVINVQGMTRGIAPLILGYQAFEPAINIGGVILNQVRGSRHESKLRAVIEHYTDVPVVGAVYHNPHLQITERHLGLIPSNESAEAEHKISQIGELVAQQVDMAQLFQIASQATDLPPASMQLDMPTQPKDVHIAIARDAAFGFYYPGDLEALETAGAHLHNFDATRDKQLPANVDALFIGGGFPESSAKQLAANQTLRRQIKQAIENGMPVYAECGGLMYLSKSITWRGQRHEMVGAIPGDAVMYDTPQGRGYVQLQETEKTPWPQIETRATPAILPGHEFHYSTLENLPDQVDFAYKVVRGTGIDGEHDGLMYKNMLACYSHLRDTSVNHWATRYVNFIRQCKTEAD